jgi:hypothetical protein
MRNMFRAVWVVFMLVVVAVLLREKGAAQQQLRPPMPPNLFTIHKLTESSPSSRPPGRT